MFGSLTGFKPVLEEPQSSVLIANTINSICVRGWNRTNVKTWGFNPALNHLSYSHVVGASGVEPLSSGPESDVIPLYYAPSFVHPE